MENQKVNEKCNCKSGKKYKKCCKINNKNNVYTIEEIKKFYKDNGLISKAVIEKNGKMEEVDMTDEDYEDIRKGMMNSKYMYVKTIL